MSIKSNIFTLMYQVGGLRVLRTLNRRNRLVTSVCFHNISDNKYLAYPAIPIITFREIIKYLNKNYTVVTLDEAAVYSGKKPSVVISFDDGFKDFYDHAMPILDEFKNPANQNIIVDCVENNKLFWTQHLNNIMNEIATKKVEFSHKIDDKTFNYKPDLSNIEQFNATFFRALLSLSLDEREEILTTIEKDYCLENNSNNNLMNWDEIRECSNNGINIGSHTLTHDLLTTITDEMKLNNEIFLSKEIIEKRIGKDVNTIAFPNGFYNDEIIKLCLSAGYDHLLTIADNRIDVQNKSNNIPRVNLIHSRIIENLFNIEGFYIGIKKILNKI